jgi:anti-sigma regulatory factor (Ser/Thr protein kinase)
MEMTGAQAALEVVDPSQVSASRAAATDVARRAGFSDDDAHRAGLVATEMATNMV